MCRSRNFFQGGGGGGGGAGPGPTPSKQSGQRFYFFYSSAYFTVYTGGPMVLLQSKLYLFKDPEGVQHFQWGLTFSRGVQMLISIETHITPDPLSPLWIRTCTYFINIWAQTAHRQLDFQFLAQDFQIEEGGSQDFLIQNVSGSTAVVCLKMTTHMQ